MYYVVEITVKVHYTWHYEDHKNNMYILYLNDDIEKWMEENIEGEWDIHNEHMSGYLVGGANMTHSLMFENEEDAVAFKLRWI